MAEVLPPILQPASTITMLSSRPSSADTYRNGAMNPPQQTSPRAQVSRGATAYHNTVGYRGASAAPTYTYHNAPYPSQDGRSSTAPGYGYTPTKVPSGAPPPVRHHGYPGSSSNSTVSSSSSSNPSLLGHRGLHLVRDDLSSGSGLTAIDLTQQAPLRIDLSIPEPDFSLSSAFEKVAKPSPDRYRRTAQRSASSGTGSKNVLQLPSEKPSVPPDTGTGSVLPDSGSGRPSSASTAQPGSRTLSDSVHTRVAAADNAQAPRQVNSDQAKRYRRRSRTETPVLGTASIAVPVYASGQATVVNTSPSSNRSQTRELRQSSAFSHERTGSGDSLGSPSRPSSHKQNAALLQPGPPLVARDLRSVESPSQSAHDASRRTTSPSPLSRPLNNTQPMKPQPPPSPVAGITPDSSAAMSQSIAAQQLAALNERDPSKGVKSRLRRAFSFGSAAELRRASTGNNLSTERAKLRKERDPGEAEEDAIVQKQEAGGIGNSIYTGQGGVFAGSTDNLSIQTTASSASVMLRKMGQGMKKGGRSLKGLFRPKSVIGVPAADAPAPQPTMAQISLVNVEAERETVNMNAQPADHNAGGTVFPNMEKHSADAIEPFEAHPDYSEADRTRKSVLANENDQTEVLAAVKRGILKRTGTSSGNSSPRLGPIGAPPTLRPSVESLASNGLPAPAHRRTDSITLEGEDYFVSGIRLGSQASKSMPNTPRGTRRINFNPRIQFYDVWSPVEYDRRGDIATCNRLTPMLAQQIKEELNTYKMEMEVHELSRVHTHFF